MDLDGDGVEDLISGSWPGEIFFFKGGPGRTFAKPMKLHDRRGKVIDIGGGVSKAPNGETVITGDARFEAGADGQSFVVYEGDRIKNSDDHPVTITGTASAVGAADWDGDGDPDLLVGNIEGGVWWIPNERDPKRAAAEPWRFGKERRLEVQREPASFLFMTFQRQADLTVCGDAGPCVVDWDGDGDLDLLVGDAQGRVSLFRNVGSRTKPDLAAGVELIPPGNVAYGEDAPLEPVRGGRAKVCAVDWNGDGLLDLLVGDAATMRVRHPEPSADEKKRIQDADARARFETLSSRRGVISQRLLGGVEKISAEERRRLGEEWNKIDDELDGLRKMIPQDVEDHGWVWWFAQTPPATRRGEG